jgi:hypothetical protein
MLTYSFAMRVPRQLNTERIDFSMKGAGKTRVIHMQKNKVESYLPQDRRINSR